ncbi:hypothetical protein Q427_10220 [Halomonas sp. BC04]|nr:hypothetical protein Q427_10220 [Halomonas sp. BC04]
MKLALGNGEVEHRGDQDAADPQGRPLGGAVQSHEEVLELQHA